MVMIKHELKQGWITLLIWTMVITFMLSLCIFIYPEMETQMADFNSMFAEMGSFSAAFGMDRLNFGEFMGFFGVECGNILGLGGAFFAALLGISALAKEEKEQTAEFLLTHPVSRRKIVGQKLVSILIQILLLNSLVVIVTAVSICAIKETPALFIIPRLSYPAGRGSLRLFWDLGFLKAGRRRDRALPGCSFLLPQYYCKPDGQGKILEICDALQLYGERGYYCG